MIERRQNCNYSDIETLVNTILSEENPKNHKLIRVDLSHYQDDVCMVKVYFVEEEHVEEQVDQKVVVIEIRPWQRISSSLVEEKAQKFPGYKIQSWNEEIEDFRRIVILCFEK